jgi:site-specific DNA-methyltransferase (adenine-specific)
MAESITFNEDCMAVMARYPDKYFDLAVVDPPYGIGMDARRLNNRASKGRYKIKQSQYLHKEWDNFCPDIVYHNELKRVSKNQIVWGANYMKGIYYGSRWIVWYKNAQSNAPDSSDCELAATSLKGVTVKMFKYDWVGFGAINAGEKRIHPTQKPVALYDWIFANYATPSQKILDTHLGSGSSRIAADKAGMDFVGCELDKDYFNAQEKRFKEYKKQLCLW